MLKTYLTNIAKAIRSRLGTTGKINAQEFPNKIHDVYTHGYDFGYDFGYDIAFNKQMLSYEDRFTNNRQRKNYCGAFCESDWSGYAFATIIYPKTSIERLFYSYGGTKFPHGIDCSQLECNKSESYYRFAFQWCSNVTEIPDMKIPAIPYYTNTYSNCKNLKKIEVIRCNKDTVFKNIFVGTPNLEEFAIVGVIGTNFDVSPCPLLNHKTFESIINGLYNFKSAGATTTRTLTVNTASMNVLTASDKNIITAKGWTLVATD